MYNWTVVSWGKLLLQFQEQEVCSHLVCVFVCSRSLRNTWQMLICGKPMRFLPIEQSQNLPSGKYFANCSQPEELEAWPSVCSSTGSLLTTTWHMFDLTIGTFGNQYQSLKKLRSDLPYACECTWPIGYSRYTWQVKSYGKPRFLDALASLDFKLSVSEWFTFFTASASTGLSELFLIWASKSLKYIQLPKKWPCWHLITTYEKRFF